jgi:hypothetical protein
MVLLSDDGLGRSRVSKEKGEKRKGVGAIDDKREKRESEAARGPG